MSLSTAFAFSCHCGEWPSHFLHAPLLGRASALFRAALLACLSADVVSAAVVAKVPGAGLRYFNFDAVLGGATSQAACYAAAALPSVRGFLIRAAFVVGSLPTL